MKILTESHYTEKAGLEATELDTYINENFSPFLVRLSQKSSVVRGFLYYKASQKFDTLVTRLTKYTMVMLFLTSLRGKKKPKIFITEFLRPRPAGRLKNLSWSFANKMIYGPALNKYLTKAQVLTRNEVDYYASILNVPPEKFVFIPWPTHSGINYVPTIDSDKQVESLGINGKYVMVSGRLNVDWKTIFAAAEISNWQLLAVCQAKDLDKVNSLNKNGKAVVLHDISSEDHSYYMNKAAVYALCLKDIDVTSVGQIRLMFANDNEVPVVASDVKGLVGYIEDGVNAILVPPHDVARLKKAIDELLVNTELRNNLVKQAKEYKKDSNFDVYFATVKKSLFLS